MTNKILDHIEHVILRGQDRAAPLGLDFSVQAQVDEPRISATKEIKIRAHLQVFFEQYIEDNAPPQIRQMKKERAKHAIARHLYGDIVQDLHELREAMWADNIRGGVDKKVSAMIRELSGEMGVFE